MSHSAFDACANLGLITDIIIIIIIIIIISLFSPRKTRVGKEKYKEVWSGKTSPGGPQRENRRAASIIIIIIIIIIKPYVSRIPRDLKKK